MSVAPVLSLCIASTRALPAGGPSHGPQQMAASHAATRHEMGGGAQTFLQAERFEYQTNEGDGRIFWDAQGWYGGDRNKLWIKSGGEYALDPDGLEEAEAQALWSRAISPFFDAQAGIRHDFDPGPSRTYGVTGIQGLAPYGFEIDAAAFLSHKGDVSARIEAEYELLLTQRLILQPRAEIELAAQDAPEQGIGAGLARGEAGLRLRYEITREVAPYIGVEWRRSFGETAGFARAAGENAGSAGFIAGLRLWY